ncbi:substrate-binding domain-containing protein [Leuconostoc gasicomitatum]|uniref:Substrate-binding domain-containing protein n=1 Tax=Leuconostoc gasicomitatum TaxID=115778 RepID=A0A9Q3SXZ9_9LACO|nr:substrate-binding domain-containing protein [Leuconostoc gasicomitatum]MBZ5962914.1 substrate-binding domain-containing protein [Leuconostoc gasicomitatum]
MKKIICVFIDSNPNPGVFTSVQPNLEFAITKALNEFKSRDFKRIGFIGGNLWNQGNNAFQFEDLRRRYFESYAKEIGVYNNEDVHIGSDFSAISGYQIGKEILQKDSIFGTPRAFLIGSDSLAIGVLRAFNDNNISIPDAAAFISINDIEIAKFSSPSLTTFRINISEMVDEALNLLYQMINNPNNASPEVVLKAPELIYRETFPKIINN